MTGRQRFVQTLLGQPADRAPFGVGIGWFPWGMTLDRWRRESGIADLNPAVAMGYDPAPVTVPAAYGPLPGFEPNVVSEDDAFIVSTDSRGLTVRNRRDGGSMAEFLDYPVKSEEDWKRYKEEHLQPRVTERMAGIDSFARDIRGLDVPVQIGSFPWGVFGSPRDLLGAEELLVGFYTQSEMIRDMMNTFTDLWLKIYEAAAERITIDHIHIWEDMSGKNGSLISMAMVEEFMMPCYDRIAAFASERGIPLLSVDSDGRVDELVPTLMRHGVNVFFPFEVQAGNDILDARRRYPGLGILGGLDKNALADHAPPEALHRELDTCEAMLASGGYIPGFDHLIPPNVSWSRWKSAVNAIRNLIGA